MKMSHYLIIVTHLISPLMNKPKKVWRVNMWIELAGDGTENKLATDDQRWAKSDSFVSLTLSTWPIKKWEYASLIIIA